jgi:SNF2 family DNA or RNA helicase
MWFEPQTRTLVYRADDALKIAAACPDARQLANGLIAVPFHLTNLQNLRRQGYPVLEPMSLYDWPGRFKPFQAQRVTSNFLALNPKSFVLSDMGSGKTLAALWAADYLMSLYPKGQFKALVVTPKSTMKFTWEAEIHQHFLGRRSCIVVHGSAEQREKLLKQNVDFYIINHDGLGVGASTQTKDPWKGVAQQLRDRPDIKLAIVDEASAYKDASTRRHKIARQIYATKDYLWLMTGTPTPNAPTDAFGLAKLVNGAQGHSFLSFQSLTMNKISNFKWVPRQGAQEEVKKLLTPAVRFAIEDCVDLPECTVQRREAELSSDQRALLKQMKDHFQIQVGQGLISAVNQGVLRMKLIQIACGAVYDNDRQTRQVDATARLRVLEEVLEEAPGKVIVFAPLTSVLHMIHDRLPSKWSRAIINGEVSQAKRSEIFQKFQNEKDPHVLIADPGTMAHGLTLTAGRTIVWYAPTDKTEVYLQANKRIHRPGQKFTTAIVQLSATATEREIYRRLESNESMQGAILKLAEER